MQIPNSTATARVIFAKGRNNSKLSKLEDYIREHADQLGFADDARVFSFSVPAGYTCPGAKECLAFANRKTGKLTHGKEQQFTCFAAVLEQIYPGVRKNVWTNFDAIKGKSTEEIAQVLEANLPAKADVIRVHVAGDFLSAEYFLAWTAVVVFSEEQALELGLEIDTDDSHACFGDKSFALLIHGQQRAGSDASKAVQALTKARKALAA